MCLSRQLTSLLPCPHPDTGYQEPPQSPQKLLLFCFVGILAVLSILATALLLWKKVGDEDPWQPRPHPTHRGLGTAPPKRGAWNRCFLGPFTPGTPASPVSSPAPSSILPVGLEQTSDPHARLPNSPQVRYCPIWIPRETRTQPWDPFSIRVPASRKVFSASQPEGGETPPPAFLDF